MRRPAPPAARSLDVSELSSQLRRAFPTANVEPVPIADNSILLEGTVDHIEDVDAVVAMARYAQAKPSPGVKNRYRTRHQSPARGRRATGAAVRARSPRCGAAIYAVWFSTS